MLRSIKIKEDDYKTLKVIAADKGMTLGSTIHELIMESLVIDPSLLRPGQPPSLHREREPLDETPTQSRHL